MAELKQFLDFAGLEAYDALIKEYIKTGSTDEIENLAANVEELSSSLEALTTASEEQQEAIDTLNTALAKLNGDDTVEGSVDSKIKAAVADLVDGAPEALDTLKEIADWISEDETGVAALVDRVAENETAIAELKSQDLATKEYIDEQDKAVYDSIQAIGKLQISSLFPVKQAEDQSVASVLAAIEEGSAVELLPDQTVAEDVVIDKDCYINANGAVFEGTVTVPADAEVIIENATFANPVVVA